MNHQKPKIARSFWWALILGFSSVGFLLPSWGKAEISGSVFLNTFQAIQSDADTKTLQNSFGLWVDSEYESDGPWAVNLSALGQYFDPSLVDEEGEFNGALREGYLDWRTSKWAVSAGRRIFTWGKGDGFNPGDVVSSFDYTFLATDEETRRLAPTGLQFEYLPHRRDVRCRKWKKLIKRNAAGKIIRRLRRCVKGHVTERREPWSLKVLLIPRFEPSRVDFRSSMLPNGVTIGSSSSNEDSLKNGEVAVEWDYRGEGWDTSWLLFYGREHLPYFVEKSRQIFSPTDVRLRLEPEHQPLLSVGGDYSHAFESVVLTAEGVFKQTSNSDGKRMDRRPSSFEAIAGLEWGFAEWHRIKLQAAYTTFLGYQSLSRFAATDPIQQGIARLNSQLHGYTEASQSNAILGWFFDNEETGWRANASVNYGLNGPEGYGEAMVGYQWQDWIETRMGVQAFSGPDQSRAELYSALNNIYLEIKGWF